MSEQIAPTTEPSTEGATMPSATPDALEGQDGDEQLGEAGKRALERERAEAKAAKQRAAEAEAKLRAIEDSQKSDAQKQSDELDRLRKAVAEHEAQQQRAALSAEVSAATGVPADVLRGDTREDLEAHAAQLKALITADTGPRVPNPGKTPENKPVSDEAAFAREFFGRD